MVFGFSPSFVKNEEPITTTRNLSNMITQRLTRLPGQEEEYKLPEPTPAKPAMLSSNNATALVKSTLPLHLEELYDLIFRTKGIHKRWTTHKTNSVNSTPFPTHDDLIYNWTSKNLTHGVQMTITKDDETVAESEELKFTANCTPPNLPTNFRVKNRTNDVVTLTWDTSPESDITKFEVMIDYLELRPQKDLFLKKRTLKNDTVILYEGSHCIKLSLSTATECKFSIKALNKCGSSEVAHGLCSVPANVGFADGAEVEVNRTKAFVALKIPSNVNATLKSVVQIIVRGKSNCTDSQVPEISRKFINMTHSDEGWVAATFSTGENRRKHLKMGNNLANRSSEKCYLLPEEIYVVFVLVIDDRVSAALISSCVIPINSFDTEYSWMIHIIWPVTFVILIICLLFFCHRCNNKRKQRSPYTSMKSSSQVQYVKDVPRVLDVTLEKLSFNNFSDIMVLKQFENRVEMAFKNGELELQFALLPRGRVKPCVEGKLPKNKSKNRYGYLIAYDETRVILGGGSSHSSSNYINANYIQGYCKDKAYIATQGPQSETIVDFWRMIWQEEVVVICMLVDLVENEKKMCEQYWPQIKKTVEYGHISVCTIDQYVEEDYTYRTFQLTSRKESRSWKVRHLQYTRWPEYGVPMYSHSIVDYLKELRSIPPGHGPIVVHCSTGTGRTGSMILCDICLRYVAAEGDVDLFAMAKKMYDARANMLDNLQQYILPHLMPTECFLLLPTKVPCSDISPEKIVELKKDLPVHTQRLMVSAWKDRALGFPGTLVTLNTNDIAKNRYPKLTPGISVEHNLIKLENGSYISAIGVDGVSAKEQYLASQIPLPTTVADFWTLVAEKKVELIVMLQRPDPKDPTCVSVIPHGKTSNPARYVTVEYKRNVEHNGHFTMDQLLIADASKRKLETRNITVLTCNNWNLEDAEPPAPETLVALWSASERVLRRKGPTLVLCNDGVTGCGLYLALCILLEKMSVDQELDVIFAVKTVRRSRPEFVNSKAQFEYLYDAALYFAGDLDIYANFT